MGSFWNSPCSHRPQIDGRLNAFLKGLGVDTLVITGAEIDVCVLATWI